MGLDGAAGEPVPVVNGGRLLPPAPPVDVVGAPLSVPPLLAFDDEVLEAPGAMPPAIPAPPPPAPDPGSAAAAMPPEPPCFEPAARSISSVSCLRSAKSG